MEPLLRSLPGSAFNFRFKQSDISLTPTKRFLPEIRCVRVETGETAFGTWKWRKLKIAIPMVQSQFLFSEAELIGDWLNMSSRSDMVESCMPRIGMQYQFNRV